MSGVRERLEAVADVLEGHENDPWAVPSGVGAADVVAMLGGERSDGYNALAALCRAVVPVLRDAADELRVRESLPVTGDGEPVRLDARVWLGGREMRVVAVSHRGRAGAGSTRPCSRREAADGCRDVETGGADTKCLDGRDGPVPIRGAACRPSGGARERAIVYDGTAE